MWWAQFFVLVHLLADPISTINNLLLKVASCQARARFWKDRVDRGLMAHLTTPHHLAYPSPAASGLQAPPRAPRQPPQLPPPTPEGIWKGLAAIVDSCDEWGPGIGTAAEGFILDRL